MVHGLITLAASSHCITKRIFMWYDKDFSPLEVKSRPDYAKYLSKCGMDCAKYVCKYGALIVRLMKERQATMVSSRRVSMVRESPRLSAKSRLRSQHARLSIFSNMLGMNNSLYVSTTLMTSKSLVW